MHRMSSKTTDIANATSSGGYYPLEWYDRQGVPAQLTKEKCEGTREHPIYGNVYRVPTDHVSAGPSQERSQELIYERVTHTSGQAKPLHKAAP